MMVAVMVMMMVMVITTLLVQGIHSDELWSVFVMPSSWVKLLFR